MRSILVGSLLAVTALLPMRALHAQTDGADGGGSTERGYGHQGHHRDFVPGVRIEAVSDGGTVIELRDGTIWEVFLEDRTNTVTWQEGDFVTIAFRPIRLGPQGQYRYELYNGRADSGAAVKFRGKAERRRREGGGSRQQEAGLRQQLAASS